ncbi:NirA family protein, partial [Bradyrhizobium sp.]|uniref:NirA family protein n=1 Tax=Bradyrhizobium sp. TaxID=376 RepID=UPI0026337BA5
MMMDTLAVDFTDEQKRYLEGFTSGLQISRVGRGLGGGVVKSGAGASEPTGPDAAHIKAQDQILASGKKLADQEKFKREEHPFDAYPRLKQQALTNAPPSPADNFRWRYYGLFYVAPAQDAFMCRVRIPGGLLNAFQLRGLAAIADDLGGGYADITTRANVQIREIPAGQAAEMLLRLSEIGLTSRGAGADNIRNITGSPTAGIDPQELIDTRPLAHELHHYILNHRELYGLPRKFNIAFDGGGRISVLEDTNDIGFAAIAVGPGEAVPEGVYFRMQLGGITGHGTFAADTGVIVRPDECVPVAVAVVRAFIEHGDRTDRKKARMKYVIDRLGLDGYMAEVEKQLGAKLTRLPLDACLPRPKRLKDG